MMDTTTYLMHNNLDTDSRPAMNSEERQTWINLISGLVINGWFYSRIWAMFHDGTSTAPDALQIWARTVIWVIPASIGSIIALTILVTVAQAIIAGGKPPAFLKDERDTKFEMWGMGMMMLFAVAGFLGAMGALALGYSGFIAFNLIYIGFSLGDVAASLLKLTLYRTGH
jgi:hypothetical protein